MPGSVPRFMRDAHVIRQLSRQAGTIACCAPAVSISFRLCYVERVVAVQHTQQCQHVEWRGDICLAGVDRLKVAKQALDTGLFCAQPIRLG